MFGRNAKNTIDSLIGSNTRIEGNVHFSGGLRIDGEVQGDVVAEPGAAGVLVVSEHGRIAGQVRCANMIVNGYIAGPVHCEELLELQPNARIVGDVHYKLLEMHGGAVVTGKLTHQQEEGGSVQLALSTA